jgi:uncharacterized membrane protein
MKQASSRIQRITVVVIALFIFLFCGLIAYWSIMPPPALAMYAHWSPTIFLFVLGLWFLSRGLFFHSRFANAIGTGENSVLSRRFGAKGTRIAFFLIGAFSLLPGVVTFLIYFFPR